ncbi:glycoside hydrolase family 11 protein [Plebeiibacterium sediminum]|uniref:Endo-1,4-beta-xylanase n=1 Tax=Plebeiibacterium sediminum TaxID=2992112 RepID=A0AAE3M898_9BACT|nr:glycoside hydrolase family 11 protein [Plebeiobacterium sediminum]MCW3789004.1 glycoside hydrolase family 11 protein [Plebeiobacterium sediminum]
MNDNRIYYFGSNQKWVIIFLLLNTLNLNAQTMCIDSKKEIIEGVKDGFRYELWNQYAQGNACMTIGAGALFCGEWSGIENYLARRGLSYDKTKEHQEIGHFFATYNCDYKPSDLSGNSYLSVYGWTVDPLIEYYIIEDWCRWIPSMDKNAKFKGTVEVNGSVYDIYENTRVNQPSIEGNTTFQQYFSIRKDKRYSGKIDISAHFKKWEELGMDMGKLYEVSFVVEGYKSNGSFEFKELDVFVE